MNMWNYRLVKRKVPKDDSVSGFEHYLEVMEVYYNKQGEITGYADADIPYGSTVEEIKEGLELIMKALDKPVIEI